MSNDQGKPDIHAAECSRQSCEKNGAPTAISALIRTVAGEWLDSERVSELMYINDGECHEFAAEVLSRTSGIHGLRDLNLADLLVGGVRDDFCELGLPFNKKLLAREWPAVKPPGGRSWKDMDRISKTALMPWGSWTHTWLTDGRLHYDAESPDGVENFFDLLIFQRLVAYESQRAGETESSEWGI